MTVVGTEEKVRSSRATRTTSAYFEIIQKPPCASL